MKLLRLPVDDCRGLVLAHTVRLPAGTVAKGTVLEDSHLAQLRDGGAERVMVARLEPGDIDENAAAARVAAALCGPGLRASPAATGRCNLLAEADGVALVAGEDLLRLNRVDESVTVATLADGAPVSAGQIVATVKIIPFAAPESAVAACTDAAAARPVLRVQPYRPRRAALIATMLPNPRGAETTEKGLAALEARMAAVRMELVHNRTCPHDEAAVAAAVAEALERADCVFVLGATATVDRGDVVPAGIAAAGGTIERLGMPVDPGNLLILARHGARPVIGVPGCARSPALNGFDMVLRRLAADLPVGSAELTAMAAGGLLKDIPERGLTRAAAVGRQGKRRPPRLAALVLAAGRSSRMEGRNKLLEPVDGKAMVARVVDAALASKAQSVVVVTGHEAERVEAALAGRAVTIARNPDFAEGLSSSLRRGLAALPPEIEAVAVCLGDMPLVDPGIIDALGAAFDAEAGRAICVPIFDGKRGNPILWARRFFPAMAAVTGDTGARRLLTEHADEVHEVAVASPAVLVDVDTLAALDAVERRPKG